MPRQAEKGIVTIAEALRSGGRGPEIPSVIVDRTGGLAFVTERREVMQQSPLTAAGS
jgi:hypothetical protein